MSAKKKVKEIPHLQLFRLCKDDESSAEALMQFTEQYKLTEVQLPEPQPIPEGHALGIPLTLPQFLTQIRERHGALVRAFLHTTIGPTSLAEQRTVFLIRSKQHFWWCDATDFVSALSQEFGKV